MFSLVFIGLNVILFTVFYYYLTWYFDYWTKKGVVGPSPKPFVGTFPKSTILLQNYLYEQDKIYRQFRGKNAFIGVFKYRTPELMILDTSLVMEILVGKFKYFNSNLTNYNKQNARLFKRNPFLLKNEEWKENRADISPAFTTKKTKQMYPMINQMCKRLTSFIKTEIGSGQPMKDTKEITAKFTADVICNVAYGLDANAINDENSEFFRISHKLFSPSYLKFWFVTFKSIFPKLFKHYEMSFVPTDVEKFYTELTDEAIRVREQLPVKPDDYLNFVLRLKEKRDQGLSDVTAHIITLLLDAYETTSIILTHALYRLAKNPHCQEKLRQEIMECGDEINFETLYKMNYLDHVFNETLRINPAGFGIIKVCSESVDLTDYNGNVVRVETGTPVHLPIFSIHTDPKYFREPFVFNPDRFDGVDLKQMRDEGKFFPFGHGPRTCIGTKYSTLVIKSAIVEIIRNFELSVDPRTIEPIAVKPIDFLYLPVHDVYLNYKTILNK